MDSEVSALTRENVAKLFLTIGELNYSTHDANYSTHDEFDSADPSSMQDACHI